MPCGVCVCVEEEGGADAATHASLTACNPCYVMLCYVMLCYVTSCYVMLCYVMLCYVMLCYVILYIMYYVP